MSQLHLIFVRAEVRKHTVVEKLLDYVMLDFNNFVRDLNAIPGNQEE